MVLDLIRQFPFKEEKIMNTKEFYCDFKNDIMGWKTNHGEDYTNGNALVLHNNDDVVKNVWHEVEPSDVYTIETRIKINSTGREQGMKLERGHMRLFSYFYMGCIKFMGADGSYEVKLDHPGDWNTIKIRVIEKTAFVYMNGKLAVVYPLGPWRSDSCQLTYFLRARDTTGIPDIEVDYVKYTPEIGAIKIVSPEDGMVIKNGTEITLEAEVDPSIPNITYYINDIPVSTPKAANDTKFTWNFPVAGNYYITAKHGDSSALGRWLTVTEGDGCVKPTVVCDKKELAFGEKVTFSLDTALGNVKNITYFVNGVKADAEYTPSVAGKCLVYAKIEYNDCSYMLTDESTFTVTANTCEGVTLQSGYTLDFKASAGTKLLASDGIYALEFGHDGENAVYMTADGERKYKLGCGAYLMQIDGGVCDVYFEKQFAFSFRMPITYKSNGITAENADGLVISGFNGTRYIDKTKPVAGFSREYALEFTVDTPRDFTIKVKDGSYLIDLTAKDRIITAATYPNGAAGVVETEALCQLTEGRHAYRIPVANGIAQLFVDNVWAYSFRLPNMESSCSVELFDIDGIQIRETYDRYIFEDNFDNKAELPSSAYYSVTDGVKADFENGTMTIIPTNAPMATEYVTYIKAYANAPIFEADICVDSASEGGAYLTARYTNEYRHLRAGYNFTEGAWQIFTVQAKKESLLANVPAKFPFGKTVKLALNVCKNKACLNVNGATVACTNEVDLPFYGVIGFITDKVTLKVTHVGYVGCGRPIPNSATFINDASTPEIFELEPGHIICTTGRLYESFDDGLTFNQAANPGFSNNTIKLSSGTMVSMHRRVADGGYIDYAHITKDDGKTWEGPFPVQDYVINRITMNNKLTEGLNGRLLFASGESGDGVEGEGGIRVFYSDDEGRTWKGASVRLFDGTVVGGKNEARMDVHNTEVNCQESKIAVMPDGTMRLYVRTDEGFLYYSTSTDNGETWSAKMYTTPFITVLSAYNIELDPHTGDYYMAWEYNVKNDHKTIQYPRTRVALAVSRDKMRTWEYVADIDEVADSNGNFGHMNIGLKPTLNAVYVDAVKYNPDSEGKFPGKNYMVRVAKNTMKTTARFSRPHLVCTKTVNVIEAEPMKNLLIVSADGKYAKLGEKNYEFTDAKAGYVSLAAVASFAGGTLTVDGGSAVVKVADFEAKFTVGTDGVQNSADGMIVPVSCLETVFGRKTFTASNGNTICCFDRFNMADTDKIARTAFWN